MTADIKGIIAPVLTPFDEDGDLVPELIADSVEYTIESGCHSVVAAGTGVQETSSLTVEEREILISETIDAVDGRRPVLAGISYPAQRPVERLIDHSEAEGADGVLAMPPWGVVPDEDAILEFFAGIGERTDLPILLYNNPRVSIDMERETMLRVAKEVDTVKYVKESSREYRKLAWLFERIHHEGYAEVFGTMDVFLPTVLTVGTGAIVPAPLSIPTMRIYDALQDGDVERALESQRVFGDFPPSAVEGNLTAVCKAATEIAGVPVGPPRSPYQGVTDEGRRAIKAWMDSSDISY